MWMVAANFRQTHSPSWLAWSEGWRPPGAQSAFIKWTGWTLAMTLVVTIAPQTVSWLLLLLLFLCLINFCLVCYCCRIKVGQRCLNETFCGCQYLHNSCREDASSCKITLSSCCWWCCEVENTAGEIKALNVLCCSQPPGIRKLTSMMKVRQKL